MNYMYKPSTNQQSCTTLCDYKHNENKIVIVTSNEGGGGQTLNW